eukprot:scaffold154446_cov20-Prasinocladus_malaysianus.AAC.2
MAATRRPAVLMWSWAHQDTGILELGTYLRLWGCIFALVTLLVAYGKREGAAAEEDSLTLVEAYKQLWAVLRLRCACRSLKHYHPTIQALKQPSVYSRSHHFPPSLLHKNIPTSSVIHVALNQCLCNIDLDD